MHLCSRSYYNDYVVIRCAEDIVVYRNSHLNRLTAVYIHIKKMLSCRLCAFSSVIGVLSLSVLL